LESASAMRQAAAIVREHLPHHPVVVVSAIGTTTDRLLNAAQQAVRGDSYFSGQHLEALRRMHFQETRAVLGTRAEPFLRDCVAPLFQELTNLAGQITEGRTCTPQVQDELLSYGERLSTLIVAEVFRHAGINAAPVDARKLIITDDQFTHAAPQRWETYARLRRSVGLLARDRVIVMGGFIGSTYGGSTTTLGRGGSDLTSTLVGAGLSADEIQIWSDVDGMLTCDPRVFGGGLRLREITYREAQEMADRGAKVLAPESIAPAIRQRIPIVIRNSRRPHLEGTRIVAHTGSAPGTAKSLNSKAGMTVVHLRARDQGILSSLTDGLSDLFKQAKVAVEVVEARKHGITFAVRSWPGLPEILRQVDQSVQIEVEEDRAAIWLVGEGVAQGDETLARADSILRSANVRVTSHGSSPMSLGFTVPEADLHKALAELHQGFFTEPDPTVFAVPPAHSATAIARTRCLQPGQPQTAPAH